MEQEDMSLVPDRIGGVLVILALVLSLVSVGLIVYYVTLPPPPGPYCPREGYVQFEGTGTNGGYRFMVHGVQGDTPLDCFSVLVIKNGSQLFRDLPTNVTEGTLAEIQGGESLSFTDTNGDGKLTTGDFFAMRNLDAYTHYELVLLWSATYNKIGGKTVHTP